MTLKSVVKVKKWRVEAVATLDGTSICTPTRLGLGSFRAVSSMTFLRRTCPKNGIIGIEVIKGCLYYSSSHDGVRVNSNGVDFRKGFRHSRGILTLSR